MKCLRDIIEKTETGKFDYEFDNDVREHIIRYKNTNYGENRRYKAFKQNIERYLSGDYGQTCKEDVVINEEAIEYETGIINAVYACDDVCCDFHSFLWKENEKQIVKTFIDYHR